MVIYITLSLGYLSWKGELVPFYPVLLFILAMEILLDVFTGFFNYKW